MQDLYFTPITTLTIAISLIIIITTLSLYYIYAAVIPSIYRFSLNTNLSTVKSLLENTSYYDYWWPKFKKFYIYKVSIKNIHDNSFQNARITLKIHSNSSKETWEILLEQTHNNVINITVIQNLNSLSKIERIFKSSLSYKRDLVLFKKALQRTLALRQETN